MPFQQTTTGLQIQDVAEIKGEYEVSLQGAFGTDVATGPESIFGILVGILSEREALIQQKAQAIQGTFSRIGAEGVDLDSIVELGGSERRGTSKSKADAGRCVGTPAVTVPDGSEVIQTTTGDVWVIVDGPGPGPGYLIGGGGDVTSVFIEAQATGVKTFLTASAFTIGTPIAGWASFNVTRDIETFETGQDIEQDGALRPRSRDEFFVNGNDLSGIKAAVSKVVGVTEVQVFENRNCTITVDTIPPGAIEVLVTGGDNLEVATAILNRAPPGTVTFGTTFSQDLADSEGNLIKIQFTRPTLVRIFMEIFLHISTAEGDLPEDFETVVRAAALAEGNANSRVGQDSLWQQFIGPIFVAIQDTFSGKYPVTEVDPRISTSGFPAPSETNISITNRQRADYDSGDINVNITS